MKVREKIKKTKKHIKIELMIPKWIERYNPYQPDLELKMPSVVAIVDKKHDDYGLAWRIDMSYAGKADQFSDIFWRPAMPLKEFEAKCKELHIDIMYI